MKKLLREWLGIEKLQTEFEMAFFAAKNKQSTLQEAERERKVNDSYEILCALLKYLDVYPYKDWERDLQYLPDEPRMKQVIKIAPEKIPSPKKSPQQ